MKINFSENEYNALKKVLNYYKIDPLFNYEDDIDLDDDASSGKVPKFQTKINKR